MPDVTTPVENIEFRPFKAPNMNPITSFLVLACVAAGAGTAYWSNLYLGLVFFAAAVVIALSIKMANVWEKFVILVFTM